MRKLVISKEPRTGECSEALLLVDKTIIIPPLSIGRIPHDRDLRANGCSVYMFSQPNTFSMLNLLINPRPVEDGEVITYVFNLSNQPVKVRRGDIISRLVAL